MVPSHTSTLKRVHRLGRNLQKTVLRTATTARNQGSETSDIEGRSDGEYDWECNEDDDADWGDEGPWSEGGDGVWRKK